MIVPGGGNTRRIRQNMCPGVLGTRILCFVVIAVGIGMEQGTNTNDTVTNFSLYVCIFKS